MPTGSIAFVVGSRYRGAGHNKSGNDRMALTIHYCNGRMRQQENLMMSIHPARMLSFSPELKDILGFKICQGAGHMFGQDPRQEIERHYDQASPVDEYREEDLHSIHSGWLHTHRPNRNIAIRGMPRDVIVKQLNVFKLAGVSAIKPTE